MLLYCYVVTENWLNGQVEKRESGATAVEYSILVGVIAMGVIGSFAFYVNAVDDAFNKVPATWPQ